MAASVDTKARAVQRFLEGFGLPVYGETSVPDDAKFPYVTYVMASSSWFGDRTTVEVNLWYRCTGEKAPNDKSDEIARALVGGVMLPCDGGAMWVNAGDPFCQSMGDPEDKNIRRRYIILSVDYVTNY